MAITENKLRQIIRQEIKLVLESRQPTEDLAELYLKLDNLLSFHFGGEQERQTLSFLNNEMMPQLEYLINVVTNVDLSKSKQINEILKFLSYFKKEPKAKQNLFTETDLQLVVKEIKNKLQELENAIFDKRVGKDKEYQQFHNKVVLPKIQELSSKLSELISSNTRFPKSQLTLTKRDILKKIKRGY